VAAGASEETGLGAQVIRAAQNYRATWHTVDSELYELCRRRPAWRSWWPLSR
jgi:hypothetical protein